MPQLLLQGLLSYLDLLRSSALKVEDMICIQTKSLYLQRYLDSHKLFDQLILNELVAFLMVRMAYGYSFLFCLNENKILFLIVSLKKKSSILLFNHRLIFLQPFLTFEYG